MRVAGAPIDLAEAVKRLAAAFDPEKIILFGSRARGDATERSDYDLLVVCRFIGARRRAMAAMDRALRGVALGRDIVVVSPDEYVAQRDLPGSVVWPAVREGRVLYERPAA